MRWFLNSGHKTCHNKYFGRLLELTANTKSCLIVCPVFNAWQKNAEHSVLWSSLYLTGKQNPTTKKLILITVINNVKVSAALISLTWNYSQLQSPRQLPPRAIIRCAVSTACFSLWSAQYCQREDASCDHLLFCSIIVRKWIWNLPDMMWEVPRNI